MYSHWQSLCPICVMKYLITIAHVSSLIHISNFFFFNEPRAQVDPGSGKNPRSTLSRTVSLERKPHPLLFLIETSSFTFQSKKSGRGAWLEFCGFPTSLSTQMGLWIVLYKNLSHLCGIFSVLGTVLRMSVILFLFFFFNPRTDPLRQVLCPLGRWAENPDV